MSFEVKFAIVTDVVGRSSFYQSMFLWI